MSYIFSTAIHEPDESVATFVKLNQRYSRYLDDGYDFEDEYEDEEEVDWAIDTNIIDNTTKFIKR